MHSKITENTLIPLGTIFGAFTILVGFIFWLSNISIKAESSVRNIEEIKMIQERRDEKIMILLKEINEKIHEMDKRIK